jgi:hypothetical protein
MSRSGSWYVLRFKDLFLVGLLPKRGIGHRRPSRMGRAGAAVGRKRKGASVEMEDIGAAESPSYRRSREAEKTLFRMDVGQPEEAHDLHCTTRVNT